MRPLGGMAEKKVPTPPTPAELSGIHTRLTIALAAKEWKPADLSRASGVDEGRIGRILELDRMTNISAF